MRRPFLWSVVVLASAGAIRGQGPPGAPGALPADLPAAPLPAAQLVTFDPRIVELRWVDQRWQLTAGGVLLKDFGKREGEGRDAVRVIRELGLNQYGTVGSPQPVMEYWLANGQAPQGTPQGLHVVEIDSLSLRAEQIQGQWCVRDARRLLFNFGSHVEEAREALGVLRKYRFTRLGYLGQGSAVMLVPLGSGTNLPPLLSASAHLATPSLSSPSLQVPRTPGAPAPGEPTQPRGVGTPPGDLGGYTPHAPKPLPLPHGRQLATPNPFGPDWTALADRVPFNWRQVQVRRDGKDWKLVHGGYTLASFGNDERGARLALSAVQFYRLTEHCLVGHPKPSFSYFLANGQAPRGVMMGLHNVSFQPEAVAVKKVDGQWSLCDGGRVLCAFGDKEEEAKQALQAVQRHKFDRLCRVGSGDDAMTFMVRVR